ncbi:MAG: hypothetical protein J3K34DRAFT_404766 [Monoraphidium minutum]|nr:MAG: hypothetical protein J3K34DRAFT_404766 [Monoraphidium minutum]
MARNAATLALLLALVGAAAALRPLGNETSAAPGGPLSTVQLDACGTSRSGQPGMVLQVSEGLCTVTSRALAFDESNSRCAAPRQGDAVELSFPCKLDDRSRPNLSGPALNLWASLSPPAAGGAAVCDVTTLSPSLFYKQRADPAFYYGYNVKALPCRRLSGAPAAGLVSEVDAALSLGSALVASSEGRMGLSYGLWLVPALPSPAQGGSSEAAQECRLAATTTGRAFLSTSTYPCSMVADPEAALGSGCCFGSPKHLEVKF